MAMLWSNNASTTVAGAITATDTSVTLNSLTFFPGNPPNTPPINTGDYFVATFYDQQTKTLNEIVHVTAVSGNTATIVRGQEGTTPLAWSAGDIFANLITAGTLENFVQKGAVPVDTTLVYVGDDTSTDPSQIVCATVPVPDHYANGMLFNIRVGKNWPAGTIANNGPVSLLLNGVLVPPISTGSPYAPFAKRTDGSDLVGGNLSQNQEYAFIYDDGSTLPTPGSSHFQVVGLQPVPTAPPYLTFYVRSTSSSVVDTNGLESNSGFFNTDASAFRTIQGAINTIKNRYISALEITIRVADGNYTSGMADNSQYISAWNIIGNTTTPENVQIICTSNTAGSYVPYAPVGVCVAVGKVSVMVVSGMTFQSAQQNCLIDGNLQLWHCHFTGPTSGLPCVDSAGECEVYGNCSFSSANTVNQWGCAHSGGHLLLGYWNGVNPPAGLNFTIVGTPTVSQGFVSGFEVGTVSVTDNVLTTTGQVHGWGFLCSQAGGIGFQTSNVGALPADGNGAAAANVGNGYITLPVAGVDPGGWITHA